MGEEKLKIALLAEKEITFPFQAVGVETFLVEGGENLAQVWKKVLSQNYGLILISNRIASLMESFLDKSPPDLPVILVLPDPRGGEEVFQRRLRSLLRRAVGIELPENV